MSSLNAGSAEVIRVAILGATGYTALELIKLLLRHPHAKITAVTSRQAGEHLSATHPSLTQRLDLNLEALTADEIADRAEAVFSCLPHAASAEAVGPLVDRGLKVIDFSADYRLNDVATYQQWYGGEHCDPLRVGKTVYGLPELFRDSIRTSQLVANPGCYPTSAILPIAPLLGAGVIELHGLIVDSKSGVSGAGRTPKLSYHYPECNESLSAYGVGTHRHMPEIAHILARSCGTLPTLIFTPHLIPMNRGILTTAYSLPRGSVTQAAVIEVLRERYRNEPFVRIVDHLPATKDVVDINYCDMTARVVQDRVITVSVLDNLIKGAAGAAVQNFNLLYGFHETTALH